MEGVSLKHRGHNKQDTQQTHNTLDTQHTINDNVMVLGNNIQLTEEQRKVLNRGLTFIPAPTKYKLLKNDFGDDLRRYHRRIKLAVFFGDDEEEGAEQGKQRFVEPSGWCPPGSELPIEVDNLINKDWKHYTEQFKIIPEKLNLTKNELEALKQLKQNRNIIIKPADKGSMVVVQEKINYIIEVDRQLNDDQYYQKLTDPIYPDTIPMVEQVLNDMMLEGYITVKQKQYLLGSKTPRERRFYTLPKVHKKTDKWTVPNLIPPGRPIVSDCESETYRTAEYIEYHLNPISNKHPSYIKDTKHFVDIIKNLRVSKK